MNTFQKEKFVEYNANARAAGRIEGVDPFAQMVSRCIRIVQTPDTELGGCVLCRSALFWSCRMKYPFKHSFSLLVLGLCFSVHIFPLQPAIQSSFSVIIASFPFLPSLNMSAVIYKYMFINAEDVIFASQGLVVAPLYFAIRYFCWFNQFT